MSNRPTCKVDQFGSKEWYLNDVLHRENGPAIEWYDGMQSWYLNGKYYCEDGHDMRVFIIGLLKWIRDVNSLQNDVLTPTLP
jgi:hypothetical protein